MKFVNTIPVICLMGPTAAGKTQIALDIVKQLPCDIISVDSAMIYRDMNIGTAKPTVAELTIAPHRLIDIRDPSESYSAAEFCNDAQREIAAIQAQGRIPLLVGGTMMYFNALQQGLSPLPAADEEVRHTLEEEAEQKGWAAMHKKLHDIDPFAAARIHPNDPQRIQRALEVYIISGQTLTELQNHKPIQQDYQFISFAVAPEERAILHQRIAQRFDHMLNQGFIDEVEQLYNRGDLTVHMPAIRSVGYRQAWDYLQGLIDKEQLREQGIAATRQLAKRQLTWLRTWENLVWLDFEQNSAVNQLLQHLKNN